jgi:radical SAM superfamily enzyme YgiQ (UPF0313 family)
MSNRVALWQGEFMAQSSGLPKIIWMSLDDAGSFVANIRPYQSHAIGLLRTILHKNGIKTDFASMRFVWSKSQIAAQIKGYDIMLMSMMSYSFPFAVVCAKIFKKVNPNGKVIVGGYHASVAAEEMEKVHEFDHICIGPGETVIADLVRDSSRFPRIVKPQGPFSMSNWPFIDRTLAPKPITGSRFWPLEHYTFEEPPTATILTSRRCYGNCSFCNERLFIPHVKRKPVDMVIDELNDLDEKYGPVKSMIIHDSCFFQHPSWLEEWHDKYPRRARTLWPYWASARTDSIRRSPDLFKSLIRETNWRTISLGLESGSDPVLKILNKQCTEEDNNYAIDLLNGIEDVKIFANFILAIPGETYEDAMKTIAMANRIRRARVSVCYYTPYAGTVLGDKILAEGRYLGKKGDIFRFAGKPAISGIDYKMYEKMLPLLKNYHPPRFRELFGRKICNALARNVLR